MGSSNDQRVLRLKRFVSVADDGAARVRLWWGRWWAVLVSTGWIFVVTGFLGLWWFVGGKTTSEDGVLITFLDSLVGIGSFALAGAVAIATIYSATRVAQGVRLAQEREATQELNQKRGRLEALIGASLEVGAYGASMGEIQRRGLRTWRRFLPEPVAQRELAVSSWRQLSSGAVAASKALERIRYEDPDLLDLAGRHYDLVVELQQAAFDGDLQRLEDCAARIRASADELWAAI